LISLRAFTLARQGRVLARDVDLAIYAGSRVGVVGPNGCGKSSLLATLAGELSVEAGELEMPADIAIAQVAQETPAADRAAIDYVLDGDAELRTVQVAVQSEDFAMQTAAFDAMERVQGFSARARAAALLHGLGFSAADHEEPVAVFSGGWRMRLNLARALFVRSDLLLLDEPTNHLDLDAVIWLERWLSGYRGTLVLVSHDRDFLNAAANRILSFESGTIVSYTGSYADFETARAQSVARDQHAHAKQSREIAHLKSFVDRFRAKATKARQVQSRLKALARMQLVAPAHVDTPYTFAFSKPDSAPSPLLVLEDAALGYRGHDVLKAVNLSIPAGARIGLLGRNGAGKSTLIKGLAGALSLRAGERRCARTLAVGYFAQQQLEQLRADETPLQHIRRIDPDAREQELRDFLGSFGFSGERSNSAVGPFSGGERSRLVLALLVRARPNLLLLDEPTNHLDLEMRHALAVALQQYQGAAVLVSHDRSLLRTTVDELWLVADARVQPFDGDLDDYRSWLQSSQDGDTVDAERSRGSRRMERRERAQRQDELAAQRRPLQLELRALEHEIARLEGERARLDEELSRPGEASGTTIAAMHKRRAGIEARLHDLESRWYRVQEALENLDRA
jgi:ATP-binding cassette subfamily F protein 3